MKKFDLENFPTLKKYIERLGAEQLNFKRFQIKETVGKYYTQKVLIKISNEGKVTCSKEGYDPTPEEASAIEKEVGSKDFPKSIKARSGQFKALQEKLAGTVLFPFYDRKTDPRSGNIMMAQQRVDHDDGSKSYIPWCFFDDAQWRAMEPDGALPFYKPEKKRCAKIMIHEGPKAARHVEMMCTSNDPQWRKTREEHPWSKELQNYEHWGIIGGALALGRTNFSELVAEAPIEVVYVCDNDWPGKEGIKDVSLHYGRPLYGINFDERWPSAWDMADEFPRTTEFFTRTGLYCGPSIEELMIPATYATEKVEVEGSKKKVAKLKRSFAEEWFHCVSPLVFAHTRWPHRQFNEQEFNTRIRPFSDVDDTSRIVKQTIAAKALGLMYDPSRPPGLQARKGTSDGGFYLNTYQPPKIESVKGDAGPWEEFLEYLLPIKSDRQAAKKWIATLIARPDIKMHYGMLLISSAQGVGKTTLGEQVLRPLLGRSNVSMPKESELVDSGFNSWQPRKRLAIVSEIYAGHSYKAYNKLKDMLTDSVCRVHEKFEKPYELENWCHMLASSNDERALKIDSEDRRWLVPKVTEVVKPSEWWDRFHEWLKDEGGLNIIKWWAENYVRDNGFVKPGERAPATQRKDEVSDSVKSAGQVLVSDVLSHLAKKYEKEPIVVYDRDLVELIKRKVYDGRNSDHLEKPLTVRKIARSGRVGSWFEGEKKLYVAGTGHVKFLTNDRGLIEADLGEISKKAKVLRLDQQSTEHEILQWL